ncbi:MAG: aminotransferase class I/II-fold pyridoxal phosphate-dependent enzyme, partial [Methanomassiliicoccales archaeon]|nr:aminotransferase class I/II-fold pyridoxal phosphate-dependent enzyme [Methanomassiliicoccales archaeon]
LRKALIEKERLQNDLHVGLDDVIITNGVTESIQMICAATIDPGDEALVPGPSYSSYLEFPKFFGGKAVTYRTIEEEGWQPDIDDLRRKITPRTKFIAVINPNTPTGAVYSPKMLKQIADLAGEYDLFLISDEIYDLMTFEGEHSSPATLAKDVPVILVNGFSKVDLVPGWRLGYSVFHDQNGRLNEIKEAVQKQLRLRLSANAPCQMAVIEALNHPKDHLEGMRQKLKARGEFAYKRINEIPGLSCTMPQAAFYMFPKIESDHWKTDKDFVLDVLNECHVLVVPGSGFCPVYGKDHFRMVFLPNIDILGKAFDSIESFMRKNA